ncbi:MAG TPA: hypothetical protein EYG18_06485 [Micavibrio sp.]|nr:hypothetical protein [Micavibrio sp.]HIL28898.1 hypothetical protein [Micavibrio sp.]
MTFKGFALTAITVTYLLTAGSAYSQGQNPDAFFRPVKSSDLVTKLPPRLDQDKRFDENTSASFGSNGCPDEINIGSIPEDSDIFGDIDIEVIVGGDVFIDCSRF